MVWLDAMAAVTLAGLVPVVVVRWCLRGARREGAWLAAWFTVSLLVGVLPRWIGGWLDPYDAYRDQFAPTTDRTALLRHADLLASQCLPRLLAGPHILDLVTDPDPGTRTDGMAPRQSSPASGRGSGTAELAAVSVTLAAAPVVVLGGIVGLGQRTTSAGRTVLAGLTGSAIVVLAGFVVNRTIVNADNYRYLVTLLVPWSLGFGLGIEAIWRRGDAARVVAVILVLGWVGGQTWALAAWYHRFGWLDAYSLPTRRAVGDAGLAWLDAHPDVRWIEADYWDVYRLAFRTGGRVHGAPFPVFPNRFPEWQRVAGARAVILVRQGEVGRIFRDQAERRGARVVAQGRGLRVLEVP